jgi:diguanylate cyclase (GGDEF)-like protein/PAS domain S-box-containing protein
MSRLEEALRLSEAHYWSRVNSVAASVTLIELVFDATQHASGCRLIEIDPTVDNTDLHGWVRTTLLEVLPTIEHHWIDMYAHLVSPPTRLPSDNHAIALADRRFEVNALLIGDPDLNRVAVLFNGNSAKHTDGAPPERTTTIAALGSFDWNTATNALSSFASAQTGLEFASVSAGSAAITPWSSVFAQVRHPAVGQSGEPAGLGKFAANLHELNAKLEKTAAAHAAITEALFVEKERAQVTLNSIGDAVICTDVGGHVTYLNAAAERLTGWLCSEGVDLPLETVFHIIDPKTRAPIQNPMALATAENKVVGLPPLCTLIRRDGSEIAIEDSTAPIHDRQGHVTGAVMVFHDVSAARNLALQLAHAAEHDDLTDLPNRSLLHDRLSMAIAASARRQSHLAALYVDLDRFKNINDSLGHPVGDRLLQSVARRLSESVRQSDTVSRQGGDEFVILLPDVNASKDAAVCADKILKAIHRPHLIEGHEIHVAASIGIALFPQDGTDVDTLLKNADSAMYAAKECGRDNYQFYRADFNASASERQTLESDLRSAIDRDELELHYQPILDMRSGTVCGVEALLRWRHPQHGFSQPAVFIPIAEESGLIVPIGKWVLREACRQAKAWEDEGMAPLRLSVNISAVELRSKDFVAGVKEILKETGFDAKRLEFELTETFLMQDSNSTATVLAAIKDLGVQLALDDFGTGYSSLSYMRRFPIDTLKIDRSFVNDLVVDADDASIVSAVINMGKSLHMRVVAEGVETQEQLAFLRQEGCSEAQGYLFSKPVSAAAFTKLTRQGVDAKWS